MLSVLFSSLQTSLNTIFSKPFLMGSLLPLVLFVAACTAMAYRVGGTVQAWVASINPAGATASAAPWNVAAALAVVFGAAVILSGLNGFLLELLEGKHIEWLGWLARWLQAGELDRFQRIDRDMGRCQYELHRFDAAPPAGGVTAWRVLIFRLQAPPPPGARAAAVTIPVDVTRVLRKRRSGGILAFHELSKAQAALSAELARGLTADLIHLKNHLVEAIQYGRERLLLEVNRLHVVRQLQFPFQPDRAVVLAPTRMGNITRTIRSYALDRYHLDLNIFWTRLQGSMVKEKDGLAALQDAKVQVDFLVSLFWLTWLFVAVWGGILIKVAPRPGDFLAVVILGPIAARILYLTACQNYLLFADQMRSAIDLYRTDLIDQLHLPRPSGNREEQALWDRAGGWLGYADECEINYNYKP
jgi:hypothetical protein